MVKFAYSRRDLKRDRLRERSSRGGKRSQELQAHARMNRKLGPRLTPSGEFLEVWTRYSVRSGKLMRYEIFKAERANQIDVIVDGVLFEALSWTKLHEMSFHKCKHMPEIVED